MSLLEDGKSVIKAEIEALQRLYEGLDCEFESAADLILKCMGRVVVTGMGKSGHIAGKIAATLASTGTPSFSVHPGELAHGDFGMLVSEDIVIAISHSGETIEITSILTPIKRRGLRLIGITSNPKSTLAQYSDLVLNLRVDQEACPYNLAPTSSTAATLALGDALAVALMKERKFSPQDFAQFHPGGALGKKLIKVSDVMLRGADQVPVIRLEDGYTMILKEISDKKMGFACVLDAKGSLSGLITDGDLRRSQLKYGTACFEKKAQDLMNPEPKVIAQDALAIEALQLMEKYRISDLVIINSERGLEGVIDLKDLLKTGIY
ncbi:MAG: KpsF/GutQ family sugar-phosphate isomerase [Candidatus Caenarcaniphilales bacterium]|nr:KpsF/GutQ family sugar-phosphate isomerase [Candidatus Caenarcaniphilales bacterium]